MSQVRYVPLDRIGTGGMATVFRARQIGLAGFERMVALKRISAEHTANPAFVDWFIREAKIACSLAHPGIVQIYDFGCDDEGYFIAMELLEGECLQQVAGRPVPIAVLVALARQLCDALDHVHRRVGSDGRTLDIVHRDISLVNLFVTRSGHLKLLDFGIASARGSTWAKHQVVGKLSYMAPEVITGSAVDARTDLFAVGVVLWQLLCGRQLFNGADDRSTVRNVLHAEIPRVRRLRPDCPQQLDDLVAAALERDPRRRPATAAAMRDVLDTTMRGWLIDATPHAIARWLGEPASVAPFEPTMLPVPTATPAPMPTKAPTWHPPVRAASAPAQPVVPSRRSFAIRLAVACTLIAAGSSALVVRSGQDAIAAAPLPTRTPPQAAPVVTPIASIAPAEPAIALAHEPPTPVRRAPVVAARTVPRVRASVPPPVVRPQVEQLQAVPAPAAPVIALAPIPAVTLPAAPRSGPVTVPPDRVRKISGELAAVNVRRLETEGVARRFSALMCVDPHGAVSSVRFLGRIPEWLERDLAPSLRAFRFTPYVVDNEPVVACFTRQVNLPNSTRL